MSFLRRRCSSQSASIDCLFHWEVLGVGFLVRASVCSFFFFVGRLGFGCCVAFFSYLEGMRDDSVKLIGFRFRLCTLMWSVVDGLFVRCGSWNWFGGLGWICIVNLCCGSFGWLKSVSDLSFIVVGSFEEAVCKAAADDTTCSFEVVFFRVGRDDLSICPRTYKRTSIGSFCFFDDEKCSVSVSITCTTGYLESKKKQKKFRLVSAPSSW